MNPLESIKSRVSGQNTEADLFSWMDTFMNEYGMSVDDFKKLNCQLFFILKERIIQRYEQQTKAMKRKK